VLAAKLSDTYTVTVFGFMLNRLTLLKTNFLTNDHTHMKVYLVHHNAFIFFKSDSCMISIGILSVSLPDKNQSVTMIHSAFTLTFFCELFTFNWTLMFHKIFCSIAKDHQLTRLLVMQTTFQKL
jgi:hypothetical protein